MLQKFQTSARKPHGSINSVWIRFAKLPCEAEPNGLSMSGAVHFRRPIPALSLNPDQENTALAAIHGASDSHSLLEMRNITLRIFDAPLKYTALRRNAETRMETEPSFLRITDLIHMVRKKRILEGIYSVQCPKCRRAIPLSKRICRGWVQGEKSPVYLSQLSTSGPFCT